MFLSLLGQTWRSVASVVIAWCLVIALLLYYPDFLATVLVGAEGIRDWLISVVAAQQSATATVIARSVITEHGVSMMFFFLFARIVVLTVILYLVGLVTGRRF